MAHFFTAGNAVALSLNLEDGAQTFYPRAFIFTNGALVGSVDLGHIGLGRYSGAWVPPDEVTYDVLFIIYEDAFHTTESPIYTREQEKWQPDSIITNSVSVDVSNIPNLSADAVWDELLAVHGIAGSAGQFLARLTQDRAENIDDTNIRIKLVEKILRNKLELADGSSGNWVLYDDDSVTPLLRWAVTDKDGDPINQAKFVPSKRTRGA